MQDSHRRIDYRVVSAAVGIATAAFGLWGLGHQGLWPDEAFSARVARLDLSTLFRVVTTADSNNALYYGLLHFWQQLGAGELWLRLPSVAFGVATVLALFGLNHRLFGLPTAITGCVLLSFNSFFIRYMQEVRVYTLALFLVVMASYCFVIALDRPSTRRWMVYGVVSALAIYAHLFSGFVLAAQLVSLAMRQDRPRVRLVGSATLLVAVLVIPLGTLMLATKQLGRSFIPEPGRDSFEWLFLYLTGGGGIPSRATHLLLVVYFLVCCVAVLFMAHATIAHRERRSNKIWSYVLMVLWLAVPVLGSFAISFARPIFYPRYLIIVLPALVTIAAIGISALPKLALRALAVGALFTLSSPVLLSYYRTPVKEGGDWRGAAEYVVREKQPGDGIIFLSSYGRGPFEYYADRLHRTSGLVPLYPDQPWGATPVLADRTAASTTMVAQRLHDVSRIWTLLVWGGFDSKAEDGAPIREVLEDSFEEVAGREFGPSVEVHLYERRMGNAPGSGGRNR